MKAYTQEQVKQIEEALQRIAPFIVDTSYAAQKADEARLELLATLRSGQEMEVVDQQINVLGSRWTHCSDSLYKASEGLPAFRQLYAIKPKD